MGNDVKYGYFRAGTKANRRRPAAGHSNAPVDIQPDGADLVQSRFIFFTMPGLGNEGAVKRQGDLAAMGMPGQIQVNGLGLQVID